jgi:hypothetical protein
VSQPLTLQEIGQRLLDAYKGMTPAQRRTMTFEALMHELKVPVGMLKRKP